MTAEESPESAPGADSTGSRILILGAGYAGLRCAQVVSKYLADPGAPEVVLVDRNDYHQIITQLPEAVSGRLATDEVAVPLAELLKRTPVRFRRTEVREIDLGRKQVLASEGILAYSTLVVALGSVTAYYGVQGLKDHALTLKSVEDAEEITRRVQQAVAGAAQTPDLARRARLLSFLIGGAGLTGVELAGELAEVLPTMARAQGIPPTEPRVTLIEAAPAVLPSMPERLQGRAAAILAELGVRLVLGSKVIAANPEGIDLASGDRLVGNTLVWTGGIMAPPLLGQSGLPTALNGHVPVNEYLQAEGFPDVYVVGDSASLPVLEGESAMPPTAQIAVKQAEAAAYNIVASWEGWPRRPYKPSDKGQLVSLGAERGVASVFHIPLVGKKVIALKALIAESYRYAATGRISLGHGRRG